MKVAELREMSVKQLKDELLALTKELFKLRIRKGVGQLTQTHHLKRVKLQVARVKTLLNQKAKSGE